VHPEQKGDAMSDQPANEKLEKLYKESSRRADDLYKSLFADCHSTMLFINPETGDIHDANEAACVYYGYTRQQLTGMNISNINTLPPEQVSGELQKATLYKASFLNFRHRLASGEIRDVEVMSGPVEIGHERLLFSIIHDVSERKRLDERVLKEKNLLDSLIHSLPGVMYLFDEFGRFHRWNDNLKTVTGYSDDEIQNMNPLNFIVSEDKASVKKAIDNVLEKGEANVESGFLTKEGVVIPYYLTGFRLVNEGVKYVVGVGIDIKEKNEAEAEKANLIKKLQDALSQVKQLSGFLPICASCKKIRDDKGYWNQIESYIRERSDAEFSHSICPDCSKKLYSDLDSNRSGS
jgi:PAS domain S-box-containing protein